MYIYIYIGRKREREREIKTKRKEREGGGGVDRDREREKEREREREREREKKRGSFQGTLWMFRLGSAQEVVCACSGQGSGSKAGLIALPDLPPQKGENLVWILEREQSRNAHKNFISRLLSGLP